MNLTDEQVIKALECCDIEQTDCWQCSLQNKWDCHFILRKITLDLINRKDKALKFSAKEIVDLKIKVEQERAEIDRLRKVLENSGEICKSCDEKYTEKIKRAKADAIKEFAERLKKKAGIFPYHYKGLIKAVTVEKIDNLVKEMVGDEE